VQHLPLAERSCVLCRGRSQSHALAAGTQNTALNRLSAWEYPENIANRSENMTFEENNLIQRVLHRPVELAAVTGNVWSSTEIFGLVIFTERLVDDNSLVAKQSGYQRGPGSRYKVEMRPRKQLTAPKMEIDLLRIQQLSEEHDDENWEFRSWLKQYAPRDIDALVKGLNQKYFALIDCKQCANCCR
jgi:hypothetical protein